MPFVIPPHLPYQEGRAANAALLYDFQAGLEKYTLTLEGGTNRHLSCDWSLEALKVYLKFQLDRFL